MLNSLVRSFLVANLIVIGLGCAATASADTRDGRIYQIIKATDSRVWRLNTHSGEIAVCSLDGEQLMCTSSAQAISPPAKTYADLEAERQEQAQLDTQRKEQKRARSVAMINLMMNAFKDIAIASSAHGDTN